MKTDGGTVRALSTIPSDQLAHRVTSERIGGCIEGTEPATDRTEPSQISNGIILRQLHQSHNRIQFDGDQFRENLLRRFTDRDCGTLDSSTMDNTVNRPIGFANLV